MKYIFALNQPSDRFISVRMEIDFTGTDALELQLPAWRPGRYELGNFAKNIKHFKVQEAGGKLVQFKKLSKDRWKINATGNPLVVTYQYFANQPDAGGCFADESLLYINPVHLCMYVIGRESEACNVELKIPPHWQTATGLDKKGNNEFSAANFDTLADSPIMSSPELKHGSYRSGETDFHIWIQGESSPDWDRIIHDFTKFTEVQLTMMKSFPVKEYHFLVLLLPYKFYHGVEHLTSTVLALGPGYMLMKPELYNDFMGVASHELFHSWNVKSIRPVEMMPYDFTKENYAETGYVYEGVTTYYGDLFLGRSGFFSLQLMLDEFSVRLQKHMDNPGRLNYAVSESSYDTWLDGYVPGVPGRKTSIYDEGCLLALMLDFMIRSSSDGKHSLDDVMSELYERFRKDGSGYSADDYRKIAEQFAGRSFDDFFDNYVNKAVSYDSLFREVISLAGLKVEEKPSAYMQERYYGFRADGKGFVNLVMQDSPAYKAGLLRDDEIISINNIRLDGNLHDLLEYFHGKSITMMISRMRSVMQVTMTPGKENYFTKYSIVPETSLTAAQLKFRHEWLQH